MAGKYPFDPPRVLPCRFCGTPFGSRYAKHWYCSNTCKRKRKHDKQWIPLQKMPRESFCDMGALTELLVCADLIKRGWDVYRAVSPGSSYDLMVSYRGLHHSVEVKKARITRKGHNIQVSVGRRHWVKKGTDYLALVCLEVNQIFYFHARVGMSTYFKTKDAATEFSIVREPNHPIEKGGA